jgi:large subunit ribosomal protein L3
MIKGLLGRKIGMTQIFRENGEVIPVTVVKVGPCVVTQIRTRERDGYEAVQIGFEEVPARKLTSPERGHLAEAKKLVKYLREFVADDISAHQVGEVLGSDMFQVGQKIDISGTSKGRGFAGVVRRHGFRGGKRTHGQSDRMRAPGAIGGGTTVNKVWKGKRMAGHMGNKRVTVQNLEVVDILADKNVLLVRGAVPGPRNGLVHVRHAAKG